MNDRAWKILLVDDDPDDYVLTRAMFVETAGRSILLQWAKTFEAGLEALKAGGYDAILVDYDLGARNGIEFIREVAANGCQAPAILLTGRGNLEVDEEAMQAGAADYLSKNSVSPPLLERTVRHAIERKQAENALQKARAELELRVAERTAELQATNAQLAGQARLLANVNDAIIATDHEYHITSWNPAAEQIYGWKSDEIVGRKSFEVLHTVVISPTPEEAQRQLEETGKFTGVVIHRHKDGHPLHMEIKAIAVKDGDGKVSGYVGVNRDITERIKAEAKLRRYAERADALANLSKVLAEAGTDNQKVMDTIVKCVVDLLGDACVLTLVDKDSQDIKPVAYYHPDPQALVFLRQLFTTSAGKPGNGASHQVFSNNQPLLVPELSQEQVRKAVRPDYWPYVEQYGIHSLLIVPLRVQDRPIGTLGVTRDRTGQSYSEEDQVFLQAMADRASLAIINARLFSALQSELAERRRVEAQLRRYAKRAEVMAEITHLLAEAGPDYPQTLSLVARRISELMGDACLITLVTEDGQQLQPAAYYHPDPEAFNVLQEIVLTTPYPVGEGYTGQVAQTGQPVLITDESAQQIRKGVKAEFRRFTDRFGVHSVLVVPLQVRGHVIGTLGLLRSRPGNPHNADDQVFLKSLAERATLAILNADLFASVQVELAERRRAEGALQASKAMFESLFDSAPDAILVVDQSGEIQQANQPAVELFGYPVDELVGQPVERLVPRRYQERHRQHRRDYLAYPVRRAMGFGLDLYAVRKDGREVPVDVVLSPLKQEDEQQVICVVRDISERKRIERALQENEARFRAVYEESALGIALKDMDGRILASNAALQEMLGYSADELRGKRYGDLTHPLDVGKEDELFRRFAQGEIQRYRMEKRYLHKNGRVVWARLAMSGVVNSEGQPDFAIVMVENTSEWKQIEAELAEVRRSLVDSRETERLQLSQEIHDGPIQDLYSIAFQISELQGEPAGEDREILPAAGSAAADSLGEMQARVQKIVQDLRVVCGELRPPTLTPFGLEKTIRSHAEAFQDAHADIDLSLDLQPDGQELPERIRLALFRIYQQSLANVIRHAQATQVEVRFYFDAEQIYLEIQDNGRGFQVPGRWYDLVREGHLGLAGSAERAEAVGGQLQVVSWPGKGTILRVEVPWQD